MFPKSRELTDEQRIAIAIKAAERSLDECNKRIKDARSGKFKTHKTKRALPFQ